MFSCLKVLVMEPPSSPYLSSINILASLGHYTKIKALSAIVLLKLG